MPPNNSFLPLSVVLLLFFNIATFHLNLTHDKGTLFLCLISLYPLCGHTQMPAKMSFHPSKDKIGHPAKIPDFHITILDIIRNTIGENVIHPHLCYFKPIVTHQFLYFTTSKSVCNRASCLGFRMPCHKFW